MGQKDNLRRKLMVFLSGLSEPISAHNLAKELGVSVRTVKYYISDINDISGKKVIASDKNGYLLHKDIEIDQKVQNNFFKSNLNLRLYLLIKEIILERNRISITKLAERMLISESTLKNTIRDMNEIAANFDVSFYTSSGIVEVSGNEERIRKLVSNIIMEHTGNIFSLRNSLEGMFDREHLIKIKSLIRRFLDEKSYKYNDYSLYNFTIHILIITERVRNGCFLTKETGSVSDNVNYDNFISTLEKELHVILPAPEKKTILFIIQTSFFIMPGEMISNASNIIGQEWILLANEIADKTQSHFMISLGSDTFISLFASHLKSLSQRVSNNKRQFNAMKIDLRKNSKVIFDISIFISFQLASIKHWVLCEDEISFIALHVGAEMERRSVLGRSDKLKCFIFCPMYNGLSQQVQKNIESDFSDSLDIIGNTSFPEDLHNISCDLVISSELLDLNINMEVVKISIFNWGQNKLLISKNIERIKQSNKKRFLKKFFDVFFNENVFFVDADCSTSTSAIEKLAVNMHQQGIVPNDFLDSVLNRESVSSTGFGQIALPHSLHMDANRTSVGILINPKGIHWGVSNSVKIVLMFAINKSQIDIYRKFYDSLVELFLDEELLDKLIRARGFNEFKEIITNEL